jgi:hypothetical protein
MNAEIIEDLKSKADEIISIGEALLEICYKANRALEGINPPAPSGDEQQQAIIKRFRNKIDRKILKHASL